MIPERVIKVGSLDEAQRAARAAGYKALVLDLENTLVPYDSPRSANALDAQIDWDRFGDCKLLVVSNARWTQSLSSIGPVPVIGRARKPFIKKARLYGALGVSEIDAVIGDQYLTDGLLAHRIGAVFIEAPLYEDDEALWPRMLRQIGLLLQRVLA